MASSVGAHKATKRVQKELKQYKDDPPEFAPEIYVNENKMNEVFILIEGPSDTPYEGGLYVLKMELPADYPMRPPSIIMLTPTGRFAVRERICTTFSDFHPETWSPSYNFSTIVKSFVSFMTEKPDHFHVGHYRDPKKGQYGHSTDKEKRDFAKNSRKFNKDAGLDKYFPCINEDPKKYEERRKAEAAAGPSKAAEKEKEKEAAAGDKRKREGEGGEAKEAPPAKEAKTPVNGKEKDKGGAPGGGNAKRAPPAPSGGAKEVVVVDDDDIVVVVD